MGTTQRSASYLPGGGGACSHVEVIPVTSIPPGSRKVSWRYAEVDLKSPSISRDSSTPGPVLVCATKTWEALTTSRHSELEAGRISLICPNLKSILRRNSGLSAFGSRSKSLTLGLNTDTQLLNQRNATTLELGGWLAFAWLTLGLGSKKCKF